MNIIPQSEGHFALGQRVIANQRWPRSWPEATGIFLIPLLVLLLQAWATHTVAVQLSAGEIIDGAQYIRQAHLLQDEPITTQRFLELGLYPLFLSQFDFVGLDMSVGSTDPKVLVVGAAQAYMLHAATAVFLFCAFIFIPGHLLKRLVICVLLGCVLINPNVVVWPTTVMTEGMTISATLLLACACLAYDSGRRWSLVLIAMGCCLLVLVREPMIFFVWILAALLMVNILVAEKDWRLLLVGAMLMVLVSSLGSARLLLQVDDPRIVEKQYLIDRSQLLANIIQFRILPNPEHRKFFVDRGLPISSIVMERSGRPAFMDNAWFESDSDLSERPEIMAYRHWVVTKGSRTYLDFLLTHPGYLLRSIAHSPNVVAKSSGDSHHLSFAETLSLASRGYMTELAPYPQWLRRFLQTPFGWVIPTLYLVFAAINYIRQTVMRQRASSLEIVAIAAGGGVFASYHADAWDLWRHAVPFIPLIHISLITRTADIAVGLLQVVRRERAKTRIETLNIRRRNV